VVQSKGQGAAMFKILVVRCKVDHRQSMMDVGLGNGILDKRRNKEGRAG